MITIRTVVWVARMVGGVVALLGWLFLLATSNTVIWLTHVAGVGPALLRWLLLLATNNIFILTHMVLGVAFALSLLVLGLLQMLTSHLRLLGVMSIAYTLILTALGFTQTGLLEGPMHWLIQVAHVVIGFGGLALVQVISVRDARLRKLHITVSLPRETMPRAIQ